ncbi:hypothetical protein [Paracoccus denitrificans]|uniref:hypothetical protein n=1 Tax=Paracoccus denitrificans TaxID=266 RepID=UPI001319FF3B|nr:hypothetical protein [Paracoccus denitrificans]
MQYWHMRPLGVENLVMTYLLGEYPVLARLAAGRTKATRLDVRACRRLYALATAADLGAMRPEERGFYDSLATSEPMPGSGGPIAALQAQVKADGFRRMADEKAFLDDLSGEPDMVPGPFRVKCLLCNSVAESWHRDFPAPAKARIGVASCACGNVSADSMGFLGYGRILSCQPDSFEVLDLA